MPEKAIPLCWLLGTSVHKNRRPAPYYQSPLLHGLHKEMLVPKKSRTGKPLFNEYAGGYLGKQAERWRLLLVRGRKTGEGIPSRARVLIWHHIMSSLFTHPWSIRLPWFLLFFDHHGGTHPTRQRRSPCLSAEIQK
jgi:hypothetical protein